MSKRLKCNMQIEDRRSGERFKIISIKRGYVFYIGNKVRGAIPIKAFKDDFEVVE